MNILKQQFEVFPYLIQYPKGYVQGKRYPVLLTLHGAGTRGITTEEYAASNMFERLEEHMEIEPFIAVAPHCTESSWFDRFETLKRFAAFVAGADFADADRIYLMGTSMGAYAAWQLGMSCPELFAALLPICGGGMYWSASRLKDIPIWAFHGALDTTVFCEESQKMVDAVNKKGGCAKLTIYPENKHDAWSDTYKNPEVFAWMLAQEKKQKTDAADECQGRAQFG